MTDNIGSRGEEAFRRMKTILETKITDEIKAKLPKSAGYSTDIEIQDLFKPKDDPDTLLEYLREESKTRLIDDTTRAGSFKEAGGIGDGHVGPILNGSILAVAPDPAQSILITLPNETKTTLENRSASREEAQKITEFIEGKIKVAANNAIHTNLVKKVGDDALAVHETDVHGDKFIPQVTAKRTGLIEWFKPTPLYYDEATDTFYTQDEFEKNIEKIFPKGMTFEEFAIRFTIMEDFALPDKLPDTVMIDTGDMTDRGPESRQVLLFMKRLKELGETKIMKEIEEKERELKAKTKGTLEYDGIKAEIEKLNKKLNEFLGITRCDHDDKGIASQHGGKGETLHGYKSHFPLTIERIQNGEAPIVRSYEFEVKEGERINLLATHAYMDRNIVTYLFMSTIFPYGDEFMNSSLFLDSSLIGSLTPTKDDCNAAREAFKKFMEQVIDDKEGKYNELKEAYNKIKKNVLRYSDLVDDCSEEERLVNAINNITGVIGKIDTSSLSMGSNGNDPKIFFLSKCLGIDNGKQECDEECINILNNCLEIRDLETKLGIEKKPAEILKVQESIGLVKAVYNSNELVEDISSLVSPRVIQSTTWQRPFNMNDGGRGSSTFINNVSLKPLFGFANEGNVGISGHTTLKEVKSERKLYSQALRELTGIHTFDARGSIHYAGRDGSKHRVSSATQQVIRKEGNKVVIEVDEGWEFERRDYSDADCHDAARRRDKIGAAEINNTTQKANVVKLYNEYKRLREYYNVQYKSKLAEDGYRVPDEEYKKILGEYNALNTFYTNNTKKFQELTTLIDHYNKKELRVKYHEEWVNATDIKIDDIKLEKAQIECVLFDFGTDGRQARLNNLRVQLDKARKDRNDADTKIKEDLKPILEKIDKIKSLITPPLPNYYEIGGYEITMSPQTQLSTTKEKAIAVPEGVPVVRRKIASPEVKLKLIELYNSIVNGKKENEIFVKGIMFDNLLYTEKPIFSASNPTDIPIEAIKQIFDDTIIDTLGGDDTAKAELREKFIGIRTRIIKSLFESSKLSNAIFSIADGVDIDEKIKQVNAFIKSAENEVRESGRDPKDFILDIVKTYLVNNDFNELPESLIVYLSEKRNIIDDVIEFAKNNGVIGRLGGLLSKDRDRFGSRKLNELTFVDNARKIIQQQFLVAINKTRRKPLNISEVITKAGRNTRDINDRTIAEVEQELQQITKGFAETLNKGAVAEDKLRTDATKKLTSEEKADAEITKSRKYVVKGDFVDATIPQKNIDEEIIGYIPIKNLRQKYDIFVTNLRSHCTTNGIELDNIEQVVNSIISEVEKKVAEIEKEKIDKAIAKERTKKGGVQLTDFEKTRITNANKIKMQEQVDMVSQAIAEYPVKLLDKARLKTLEESFLGLTDVGRKFAGKSGNDFYTVNPTVLKSRFNKWKEKADRLTKANWKLIRRGEIVERANKYANIANVNEKLSSAEKLAYLERKIQRHQRRYYMKTVTATGVSGSDTPIRTHQEVAVLTLLGKYGAKEEIVETEVEEVIGKGRVKRETIISEAVEDGNGATVKSYWDAIAKETDDIRRNERIKELTDTEEFQDSYIAIATDRLFSGFSDIRGDNVIIDKYTKKLRVVDAYSPEYTMFETNEDSFGGRVFNLGKLTEVDITDKDIFSKINLMYLGLETDDEVERAREAAIAELRGNMPNDVAINPYIGKIPPVGGVDLLFQCDDGEIVDDRFLMTLEKKYLRTNGGNVCSLFEFITKINNINEMSGEPELKNALIVLLESVQKNAASFTGMDSVIHEIDIETRKKILRLFGCKEDDNKLKETSMNVFFYAGKFKSFIYLKANYPKLLDYYVKRLNALEKKELSKASSSSPSDFNPDKKIINNVAEQSFPTFFLKLSELMEYSKTRGSESFAFSDNSFGEVLKKYLADIGDSSGGHEDFEHKMTKKILDSMNNSILNHLNTIKGLLNKIGDGPNGYDNDLNKTEKETLKISLFALQNTRKFIRIIQAGLTDGKIINSYGNDDKLVEDSLAEMEEYIDKFLNIQTADPNSIKFSNITATNNEIINEAKLKSIIAEKRTDTIATIEDITKEFKEQIDIARSLDIIGEGKIDAEAIRTKAGGAIKTVKERQAARKQLLDEEAKKIVESNKKVGGAVATADEVKALIQEKTNDPLTKKEKEKKETSKAVSIIGNAVSALDNESIRKDDRTEETTANTLQKTVKAVKELEEKIKKDTSVTIEGGGADDSKITKVEASKELQDSIVKSRKMIKTAMGIDKEKVRQSEVETLMQVEDALAKSIQSNTESSLFKDTLDKMSKALNDNSVDTIRIGGADLHFFGRYGTEIKKIPIVTATKALISNEGVLDKVVSQFYDDNKADDTFIKNLLSTGFGERGRNNAAKGEDDNDKKTYCVKKIKEIILNIIDISKGELNSLKQIGNFTIKDNTIEYVGKIKRQTIGLGA